MEKRIDRRSNRTDIGTRFTDPAVRTSVEVDVALMDCLHEQVLTIEQILRIRKVVETVYMDEKVKRYIVDIVFATRRPNEYGLEEIEGLVEYGASPRATIYLAMAAKAHAFLRKRGYVIPEDIKLIGPDVLRHRIIPTYEAEAEEMSTDDIVRKVFEHVKVP